MRELEVMISTDISGMITWGFSLDPNLPSSEGYDDLLECDSVMLCVSSILVDPAFDELDFLWSEERFLLQHFVWEVDDEEIPHNRKNTGN